MHENLTPDEVAEVVWKNEMTSTVGELVDQMKKHNTVIFGNGEPGLDEQMRSQAKNQKYTMGKVDEISASIRRLVWGVATSIITVVTGIVLAALKTGLFD